MKNCSVSLAIVEEGPAKNNRQISLQGATQMKSTLSLVCRWGCGEPGPLLCHQWNGRNGVILCRTAWQFSKMKCKLSLWPSSSALRCLRKRNKNTCLHRNVCANVYRNIIYSSWELKTIQVSINWWTDKSARGFPYTVVLLRIKKKLTTDTGNHLVILPSAMLVKKKPDVEDGVKYDSTYREF